MNTWWQGTALMAERGLLENVRSRSFKVVTGLLLLLAVAAVAIPQIIGKEGTTYTLATTGKAPADVVAVLDAAGRSAEFTVTYVRRFDEAAVRTAVRDGDANHATARVRSPPATGGRPMLSVTCTATASGATTTSSWTNVTVPTAKTFPTSTWLGVGNG